MIIRSLAFAFAGIALVGAITVAAAVWASLNPRTSPVIDIFAAILQLLWPLALWVPLASSIAALVCAAVTLRGHARALPVLVAGLSVVSLTTLALSVTVFVHAVSTVTSA